MSKVQFASIVLIAGMVFSGCSLGTGPTTAEDSKPSVAAQKQGDTRKSGTVRKQGAVFMIETGPGTFESIDSLAVDLAAYENQVVTITGQYSGDTLFVGKVE